MKIKLRREVAGVIMGTIGDIGNYFFDYDQCTRSAQCLYNCLSQIVLSNGQKGGFYPKAAYVHATYRTPYISILFSSGWSCILVISGTFDLLTNLVIFTGFLFFGLVAIGLMKLKRNGSIKTKIIGYPFSPVIIILFSLILVINTAIIQPKASLMGLLLVGSGIPFYFYFRKINKNTDGYMTIFRLMFPVILMLSGQIIK